MDFRRSDGTVLVVVLAGTLLVAAIAAALVMASSSEVMVAASFRRAVEALYAADLAAERALSDLAFLSTWDDVLLGSVRSSFVDGPPAGTRALPDGSSLDLSQVLNLATCRKATTCSSADMDLVTRDRPWGKNNPRWQLYAYGRVADLAPGADDLPYYAVIMVGDDPSETDEDPLHDAQNGVGDGAGTLALRSEAFGPRGAHRAVELIVDRTAAGHLRVVSWCALR